MKLVSLFAGVGGFDLAAEQSGIEPSLCCEIDPMAKGVLKHRFPDAILIDDVKDITGDKLRELGFSPETTIISGGFPCQDVSIAGKRKGFEGERSSLFFEIVRILREFNPKWFVLENVPGLFTSHEGRDMGAVVGTLADLGYVFGWRVLDSQFFGVPQRRRRVFIVGCAGGGRGMVEQVLFECEGGFGDSSKVVTAGEEIAGSSGNSVISTLQSRHAKGVDAEGAAGGQLVAFRASQHGQYAEGIGPLTARYGKDGKEGLIASPTWNPIVDVVGTLSGGAHPGGLNGQDAYTGQLAIQQPATYVKAKRAQTSEDDETWRADGIAPTVNGFDARDTRATVIIDQAPISFNWQNGGGYGNANPGLGITEDGVGPLSRSQVPAVTASTVRRLTPRECERLQGFPDDWTAQRFDFKKGKVVDQSDSSRYKQMGNAVTVNVVRWIFNNLMKSENQK